MQRTLLALLLVLSAAQAAWPDQPGIGYEKPVRLVVHANKTGTVTTGLLNYSRFLAPYSVNLSGFTVFDNNTHEVPSFYVQEGGLFLVYWNASADTTYYVYAGQGDSTAVRREPNITRKTFYLVNPLPHNTSDVYVYPWYRLSEPYCHEHDNTTCYGWLEHNVTGPVYKLVFMTMPLVGWSELWDGCYRTPSAPGAYTVFNYSAEVTLDNGPLLSLVYNHTGSEYNWNGVPWPPETKYPGENKTILFQSMLSGNHTIRLEPDYGGRGYSCHYTIPNAGGQQYFGSSGTVALDEYKLPAGTTPAGYVLENRALLSISCPQVLLAGENFSFNLTNHGTEQGVNLTVSVSGNVSIIALNASAEVRTMLTQDAPGEAVIPVRAFYSGKTWEEYCDVLYYSVQDSVNGTVRLLNDSIAVNATYTRTALFNHSNTTNATGLVSLCENQSTITDCAGGDCVTRASCSQNKTFQSSVFRLEQTPGINSSFNGAAYYSKTAFLPNPFNTTFNATLEGQNSSILIPAGGLAYQENYSGRFLNATGPFNETVKGCVNPGEDPLVSGRFMLYNTGPIAFNASLSYSDNTSWFYLQPNQTENVTLSYHLLRTEAEHLPGYAECSQELQPRPSYSGGGGFSGGAAGGPVIVAPAVEEEPEQPASPTNTSANLTAREKPAENSSSKSSVGQADLSQELPSVVLSAVADNLSLSGDADYCYVTFPDKTSVRMVPGNSVTVTSVGETYAGYNCFKGNASVKGVRKLFFFKPLENRSIHDRSVTRGVTVSGMALLDPLFLTPAALVSLALVLMLKKVNPHK